MRHTHPLEKLGQDRCRKSWLPLIEIAGQQINRKKPTPLKLGERSEERVAVLAARKAHKPARLRRRGPVNHGVLIDGLAGLTHDALAEFPELRCLGRAVKERMDVVGIIEHGPGMPEPPERAKRVTIQ